ncbi:MAG TPA: MliC family protein [Burkholderiaceae bacterium]|nr:MliC family protein [Burkholderiaceae bacterium]
MTLKTLPLGLFVAVALSGCGTAASKIPAAFFTCADGSHFSASFPEGEALITLPDQKTLTLPQQRAGSGYWYSSGRYELRGKGKDATWTVGRRAPTSCRSQP